MGSGMEDKDQAIYKIPDSSKTGKFMKKMTARVQLLWARNGHYCGWVRVRKEWIGKKVKVEVIE